MKKFTKTILFALTLAITCLSATISAVAQCTPRTIPFREDFKNLGSTTLPACASAVDSDATGTTWVAIKNQYNAADTTLIIQESAGAKTYNNWYYTQPLALFKDSLYQLRFIHSGFQKGGVPVALEVLWGADTTLPDSMHKNTALYNTTTYVRSGNIKDTVIAYFKPTRTTKYYIAFHDYTTVTTAPTYQQMIDSITVIRPPFNALNDMQLVAISKPTRAVHVCPDSTIDTVQIIVVNNSKDTVKKVPIEIRLDGPMKDTIRDTIIALPSLAYDTLTYTKYKLTMPGTYTITAFTELTGDDSHGNDTMRTTIIVDPLPDAGTITATAGTPGTYIFSTMGSANVTTYNWSFGDGTTDAGALVSHTYTANGKDTVVLIASNNCGSDTATTIVEVTGIVPGSVANATAKDALIKIYPNPAQNVINVANLIDAQRLTVYNSIGQIVYQNEQPGNNQSIVTTTWAPGLYIISIKNSDGYATRKVQIMK